MHSWQVSFCATPPPPKHAPPAAFPISPACLRPHPPFCPAPPPPARQMYDIWNEVLHYRTFIDACGLWNDTLRDAFIWANRVDPTALLCINE